MNFLQYTGHWRLTASVSAEQSRISFVTGEPDPNGVSDWLNAVDITLYKKARPTSGLELETQADNRFSERVNGEPKVDWYDADGVSTPEVVPFSGVLAADESGAVYLQADDLPNYAKPTAGQYGSAILRYDDGDTKISDRIAISGNKLVRCVNVVTDELYLERVVIIYEKVT